MGTPGSYPRSLAATTQLTADRLAGEDPAAYELASLCAFLAPEPIPEELFTGAASELPGPLAAWVTDPLAWRQTLAHLARQSLARIDHRGLQLHRLTQGILRDRLAAEQAVATRKRTEAILAASSPGDPGNPATWPRWAQLMPHLLAADLAATGNRNLRWVACDACWYLKARGDARSDHDLASHLYPQWREHLKGTVARARRVLGEDHPDTLASASNLAADLRALGEA